MNRLLIDAVGALDQFPTVEHIFDFYPNRFKGLVTDLLRHHLSQLDRSEDDDQNFVHTVLDRYHDSPNYPPMMYDAEESAREYALSLATYMVYRTTLEFVQYHRRFLVGCKLDPETMELGSEFEYISLERI